MKRLRDISVVYLTLPFILFLLGWYRKFIALPIALLILFGVYRIFKRPAEIESTLEDDRQKWLPTLLILTLWLILSGIGGYAFQNWDHNWRNVVFHDLINFKWPVYYAQPAEGAVKALVYYFGFWLPAALIGKFANAQIANVALFLWTFVGLTLIVRSLSACLKTSTFKALLILIFFSGLDFFGALFSSQDYPTLFPPISHLEVWTKGLQYSSLTTQLFWVYNQAAPTWLCVVLIENLSREARKHNRRGEEALFIGALCFFFAPLASIGLFPYILFQLIRQTDFKAPFKNLRWEVLLSAVAIFLLSYFFFSANGAAQARGFQPQPPIKYFVFFLLEGGALWLILAPLKIRDPRWMISGILLATIPFVKLGVGNDFVMRASIAPLFYLMLLSGEALFDLSAPRWTRTAIIVLLIFGAMTPLYEINRSVYRTYQYYFVLTDAQKMQTPPSEALTHLPLPVVPEKEHPYTLAADALPTLKYMTDELSRNFIADLRSTFFYQYFARR